MTSSTLNGSDLASLISRKNRLRYRLRVGPTTYYENRGFQSRKQADTWIECLIERYGLDWRVGYQVKLRGMDQPFFIVDNSGAELKP